jgi:hypothetical protein
MTSTLTQEQAQEQAKAIRMLVIGALVCEYAVRWLPPQKNELKMRANAVINASLKLQNYFIGHRNSTQENREIFKREFMKNEVVLISEILETLWGISENDLEEILNVLKEHIVG